MSERDAVFCLLAQAGASTAETVYDGSGDEGYIVAITARSPDGEPVLLPPEVEERVRDFVTDSLPEGWEIDVLASQVRYSLYSRYTEVNYDEWVA